MRILALATVAVVFLAACSGSGDASQASSASTATPPATDQGGEAPVRKLQQDANAILVGGVPLQLHFERKVVYNRTAELKPGLVQRQIFVQALTASVEEVEAEVVKSLADAGFSVAKQTPSSGGKRLDFRNDAGKRLSVLVRPRLNPKQDGSSATGVAQFTFRD